MISEFGLQAQSLIIIIPNPLPIEDDLLDTRIRDELRLQVLPADKALDLALREDASELCAFACSGRSSPCAAVVCALWVRESVSATVVCDAEVDLAGREVAEPEEVERRVDFLQVGVGFDEGAEAGCRGIPGLVLR